MTPALYAATVLPLAAVLLGITAWLRWAEKRHTEWVDTTHEEHR